MPEDSPFSNERLAEAIYDIRDRIIRVEERQQRTEAIEDKADEALRIGREANSKADENARDIESMRTMTKWAITAALSFVGVAVAIIAILLQ